MCQRSTHSAQALKDDRLHMAVGIDTSKRLDLIIKRLHSLKAPKAGLVCVDNESVCTFKGAHVDHGMTSHWFYLFMVGCRSSLAASFFWRYRTM